MKRYVIADHEAQPGAGWEHIFEDENGAPSPTIIRFVFDTQANRLVAGASYDRGWYPFGSSSLDEVEDSLRGANSEALENPAAYGLLSSDELPAWARNEPQAKNDDAGMEP